ncbi:MAG: hypothetical protein QOG50_1474 [Actinomycetota bacterium]|nr:hypothetical protein [Actinomycetota bacterium]
MSVSARRRFFFVHIHKAGGTSLWQRMARQFAPQAMYPDSSDGDRYAVFPQISVAQLLERWEQRRAQIEIIAGHFPLSTIDLLGADFVTLTVLREPVERTISQLRRLQSRPEAREMSLESIYERRVRTVSRNHMVKMFSLTADEVAAAAGENKWPMILQVEFTPERLARAKEQIGRVDVVGLQDRFEEFCDELRSRFHWELGDSVHANRGPHEEVPEALRARIAADNAMDIEFFDFAGGLYERRRSERENPS